MYDILLIALGAALGAGAAALSLLPRLRRREAALERAEIEIASLTRGSGADPQIAAENADLRRRMDELADAILARGGSAPKA